MREIKFRAKCGLDWVYGYYLGIRWGHPSFWVPEFGYAVEVKEGSIGQFTGLHDKNGKEIYDGDILQGHVHEHWGNFKVTFDAGAFSLWVKDDYWPCLYEAIPERDMKVIGNVHDNPELLQTN